MNNLDEHMVDEISKEMAFRLIDLRSFPVHEAMDFLLDDKTTGKNIIWATDAYTSYGRGCSDKDHITKQAFTSGKPVILLPRIEKALEQQQERTRSKAEVFTPIWLCNLMNNYCDEQWFGRKDVFNHENDDHTWTVTEGKIEFPEGKTWQDYVYSRRLEITCGEAPYLVSRYDAATGEFIEPTLRRIGVLDRKLRIVNENTESKEEWIKWAEKAYQSCYGYEYQGDSLLIARINLLITYQDYFTERWECDPSLDDVKHIANIIAWNTWQMDGLKDTVPFGKPYHEQRQMTLFDSFGVTEKKPQESVALPCKIFNWRSNSSLLFKKCKRVKMGKKMFDFVIGNPPYQQEFTDEGNKTYAAPVYHDFMDAAFKVGDAVELIHPARFLFNAGSTPKAWNQKMLNDPHFKVLQYVEDASKVFPGPEIKGGVAITYYDSSKTYEPIEVFTKYPSLNTILSKVHHSNIQNLTSIAQSSYAYHFTEKLYAEHPELKGKLSVGHEFDLKSNVFDKIPQAFCDTVLDDCQYICVYGRCNNERIKKYLKREYLNETPNLFKFKLFLPSANGNGVFGEVISMPLICPPGTAHTETFLSVGACDSELEAKAILCYFKTKFCRALMGVLKTTQHLTPGVMAFIPLQNFTSSSDIDWSKSISEIDRQLYSKYKLSSDEIEFIESHVQEMN